MPGRQGCLRLPESIGSSSNGMIRGLRRGREVGTGDWPHSSYGRNDQKCNCRWGL